MVDLDGGGGFMGGFRRTGVVFRCTQAAENALHSALLINGRNG